MDVLKYFPAIMAVLDIIAACIYLAIGDRPRAIYWASAAMLTISTFFIKKF